MNPKTVYVTLQTFCETNDLPLRLLQEAGFDIKRNRLNRRMVPDEMPRMLQGVEAVIAGVEPYERELLVRLPNLQCISRCGSGTDSIDLEAAQKHGIAVLNTPEEVVEPVAELTLGMILALARNFPQHQWDLHTGSWRKLTGHLLREWTIGLVGFGRIGRAVEKLLRPFGPRCLVTDPKLSEHDCPDTVQLCSLPHLLSQSDLISLHVGRAPQEGVLLGHGELRSMKPGARLVNTARGTLIDEQALLEALEAGHLAAAALDVFESEPYSGPLVKLPQVLLTPHVATLTQSSRAAMELRAVENLIQFFTVALVQEKLS